MSHAHPYGRQPARALWLPALAFMAAALATLDRVLVAAAWLVLGLSLVDWRWRRGTGHHPAASVLLAASGLLCLATLFTQLYGADSLSYFVYARSMLFDGDLDFANEHAAWGLGEPRLTQTGRVFNAQSVGPAILWTPFVLGTHAYVLSRHWLGTPIGAPDGLGEPYLNSTLIGTATIAALGMLWLWRALSERFGRLAAAGGVATASLCSPVAYYVLISPAMAHGLEYGVACMFLAAWLESQRAPGTRPWLVLGALWGLLALLRWQAALLGVFVLAFGLARPREGSPRLARGLAAVAAAGLVFVPQLLAWQALFGQWLTMPQGSGFVDWSSPRFLSVLISTDRGLFNWHPLMLAGAGGLLPLLARPGLRGFAAASVVSVTATAWVNGGVADWAASDAFGARRFALVVPVLAVGIAEMTRLLTGAVARHPGLVAGGLIGLAAVWNLSLMGLYRTRAVDTTPTPLARVTALQTQRLQEAIEAAALRLGGPGLRNLVYEAFVGEYFYDNANPAGIINVGRPESPYLEEGWSRARQHPGWPNFRWALHPRACVRVPLREPFPLRTTLRARAPDGLVGQVVTIEVNDVPVHVAALPNEWTDIDFIIPERPLVPGPNRLCLVFKTAPPDSDGGPVAAAVSVIQLP